MAFQPGKAHDIPFVLINKTTGAVLTGATVTGYRCIDGGTQESISGSISELGNGQYLFEGGIEDFDMDESVGLLFTATDAVPVHILAQAKYFHRSTAYSLPFLLINSSNGNGLTGATVTGKRCLDGGSQESVSGTFTEKGNGQYVFNALAADFGATDVVGLLFTASNAMPVHFAIDLVRVQSETDVLSESPASVLSTYIVSLGYMTVPSASSDWPLYISHLPDGDEVNDDAGALFDTTPLKDGRLMTGPIVQHFGVNLMIRSIDYDDGWDKINEISSAFDAVAQETVTRNSVDYLIENIARGGVNPIGIEEGTKRRYLFTTDFLLTMRQV